jgi:hypothetical protein
MTATRRPSGALDCLGDPLLRRHLHHRHRSRGPGQPPDPPLPRRQQRSRWSAAGPGRPPAVGLRDVNERVEHRQPVVGHPQAWVAPFRLRPATRERTRGPGRRPNHGDGRPSPGRPSHPRGSGGRGHPERAASMRAPHGSVWTINLGEAPPKSQTTVVAACNSSSHASALPPTGFRRGTERPVSAAERVYRRGFSSLGTGPTPRRTSAP